MTGLLVAADTSNPGRGTIFRHYADVKASLQEMQDWIGKMQNCWLKLPKCLFKVQDMLKNRNTCKLRCRPLPALRFRLFAKTAGQICPIPLRIAVSEKREAGSSVVPYACSISSPLNQQSLELSDDLLDCARREDTNARSLSGAPIEAPYLIGQNRSFYW